MLKLFDELIVTQKTFLNLVDRRAPNVFRQSFEILDEFSVLDIFNNWELFELVFCHGDPLFPSALPIIVGDLDYFRQIKKMISIIYNTR